MDKEQYVTFEVAKLLKDKGFDWECRTKYNSNGCIHDNVRMSIGKFMTNLQFFPQEYSAPTQQMACRWFWEEKGLNINAIYGDYPSQKRSFWMPQIDSLDGCYGVDDEDFFREYDSREDCIGAALLYCLKNII